MNIQRAEQIITELLKTRLSPDLYYHNLEHTQGVVRSAVELARLEGITSGYDLDILKTAAWFHDSGYINSYENHEEESCALARQILPSEGYSDPDIELVCHLIMKTKVPQQPVSDLEKILCDADLDYLGWPDFLPIAHNLFREWHSKGRIEDENQFNQLQIKFLTSHKYWTNAAKKLRQPLKEEHLRKLKELCEL